MNKTKKLWDSHVIIWTIWNKEWTLGWWSSLVFPYSFFSISDWLWFYVNGDNNDFHYGVSTGMCHCFCCKSLTLSLPSLCLVPFSSFMSQVYILTALTKREWQAQVSYLTTQTIHGIQMSTIIVTKYAINITTIWE